MGVTNALYNYGFEYNNPDKPYELDGFVNSAGAVKALEFYKELYDTATPPGSSNWYMGENIDAYKSGQVALQMNLPLFGPVLKQMQMLVVASLGISQILPALVVILRS